MLHAMPKQTKFILLILYSLQRIITDYIVLRLRIITVASMEFKPLIFATLRFGRPMTFNEAANSLHIQRAKERPSNLV